MIARGKPAAIVAIAALVIALPFFATPYQQSLALLFFMYVALAASWNVISGYAGYFSFGHVAYFGLGSYVAAIAIGDAGWHWLAAALAAAAAAGLLAIVAGYPALRIKGPAFAIVTLALAQALRILVYIFDGWTGGGHGKSLTPADSLVPAYFALAIAAVIAIAGTRLIERSAFGRELVAIRDDETGAEAIGIDTAAAKLKAFALSALLPGFCGAIYAWYLSYVHPEESFSLRINISMIVMALLGGAGTVAGPVIGAAIVFLVSELLWARFPVLHQLIFGLLVIVLVLAIPDGIVGTWRRRHAAR